MFFIGCPARSIQPLFAEKESVLLPGLAGTWMSEEDIYTFEQLPGNHYRALIRSKTESDSAVYMVSSGKLGAYWFLDSSPIKNSDEHHYLSVHVFTRIEVRGDTMRFATLEADWLKKQIESNAIVVTHTMRENEVLLTATTKELQKFLTSIASNNEAFPNPATFVRSR